MKHDFKSDLSLEVIWSKIDSLDLGCIKVKLVSKEHGEGWSRLKADRVAVAYKQFLFLNYKYPDENVVVNKQIDTFWHYHILDTLKYHEDCDQLFGRYIHHFPYFGMRSERDAVELREAYDSSLNKFRDEFGPLDPIAFGDGSPSQCADVCTTPCDSPIDAKVSARLIAGSEAQCANVCTTPCENVTALTKSSTERPVWVSS